MDIWFEIKAGKYTISDTGEIEENIEASQLAKLTTLSGNLVGLLAIHDKELTDLFVESLKRLKFEVSHKSVYQKQ